MTIQHISQAKYILDASLAEVLRHKDLEDVKRTKHVVFELLESPRDDLEMVKFALLEGYILDAADKLCELARRSVPSPEDLYLKAALLYMPLLSFSALDAFECAEKLGADIRKNHDQMAKLYRQMGNINKAEHHEKLDQELNGVPVFVAGKSVADDRTGLDYAGNISILPVTLIGDDESTFSTNLKL